ncbi:hypothetical protein R3I93_008346 [Phoxinus phoxinus]|uniref:Uncharacterized protein n=1 Tax=Phoxinus phoxinus TaxID=58324 RepID=A0AAN9H9I6_9TELE
MKKKNKDMEFIKQKMDITFSLRRMEIVEMEPMVSEVLERWPGLFLEEQTSDITSHRRQVAVEGLPIFLRENTEKLFSRCLATDADDKQVKGIKMGVLTVLDDDDDTVINIALVLEETIVLKDIPDTPTALAYLFGLLYALNMEFPKDIKYTCETIQHIFMEMSTNCSQRVRSFKTKLLNQ